MATYELIYVLGKNTETSVNDILEQQTSVLTLLEQEFCTSLKHVSKDRSDQFFSIIESFRTIVEECGDVGRSVSSVGRAFKTKPGNRQKAIETLKGDLNRLNQIRTRIPGLQVTLNEAIRAVGRDIFISKVLIGVSVTIAILGIAAMITVLTFGIGAAVGCPVLCSVLISMGVADEILIGIGASMALGGAAFSIAGVVKARDSIKTENQLVKLNDIYDQLVDETATLEKSVQLALHEVDEIIKDDALDVAKIAEVGDKLETSGNRLSQHSLGTLNRLVDIKAQLIKRSKNNSSGCILL